MPGASLALFADLGACHVQKSSVTICVLPAPFRWRATPLLPPISMRWIYFYPRPPGGGRRAKSACPFEVASFLSTPSGWRAIPLFSVEDRLRMHFYPRPLGGGRRPQGCNTDYRLYFYPRPPGGGRPFCISKDICVYNFYPRPPGGGRLSHSMFPRTAETISIHALRVEGDKIAPFVKHLHYISIHALRVEGDKSIFDRLRRRIRNFYPRPPGGGRQVWGYKAYTNQHFYPRPPGGGRLTTR